MPILDVIKFDGFVERKWLVYRYPDFEFNHKSKVIVGHGQIAIVVHGGKVERILQSGTYELNTENFPFLKGLVKRIYGGSTPYQVLVYYVNRTIKLDMFWGTSDSIQMLDPKFQVKINVRARGQYGLRISEYQLLLTQLIGTIGDSSIIEFDEVNKFFRGLINQKIKVILAQYLINNNIGILEISLHLDEISESSKASLSAHFAKFGMELVNFYYETVDIPNEDLEIINKILNKNAEFNIMGEQRYRTARGYDVLEKTAENEGAAGGLASAGMGLGVGMQVAKNSSEMTSNIIPPTESDSKDFKFCSDCGAKIKKTAKFCPDCGAKLGV